MRNTPPCLDRLGLDAPHEAEIRIDPVPMLAPERLAPAVQVFEQFRQIRKTSIDDWQAALDAALRDDTLADLAARTDFEGRVAKLLTDGWQPGHEYLLPIAIATFHWDTERAALRAHGAAGAVLDRALDELQTLKFAPEPYNWMHQHAMRMLRTPTPPSRGQLRREMADVERAARLYPTLLPIFTDAAVLAAWRRAYASLPGAQPLASLSAGPAPQASTRWRARPAFTIAWVLFFAVNVWWGVAALRRPPPAPTLPTTDIWQRVADKLAFEGAPPAGATGAAIYEVHLDDQGRLRYLIRSQGSGDKAFDTEVERAIRAAAPYPGDVPWKFDLNMSWRPRGPAPEACTPVRICLLNGAQPTGPTRDRRPPPRGGGSMDGWNGPGG